VELHVAHPELRGAGAELRGAQLQDFAKKSGGQELHNLLSINRLRHKRIPQLLVRRIRHRAARAAPPQWVLAPKTKLDEPLARIINLPGK
jgi:hypothetical protein